MPKPATPPGGWIAFWMLAMLFVYVVFGLALYATGVL